jgi:hypothetical protein
MWAQDSKKEKDKKHIVKDWSTHHLVFSKAGTKDEAIARGTYDRWLKVVNDPRYIMQQEERAPAPQAPLTLPAVRAEDNAAIEAGEGRETQEDRVADVGLTSVVAEEDAAQFPGGVLPRGLVRAVIPPPVQLAGSESDLTSNSAAAAKKKKPPKNRIKKDWSEILQSTSGTAGVAGATTGMGQFPATYSSGATSCSDFAIYNTGLAGTSSQPNVIAYKSLYTSCNSGTPTVYFSNNTSSGNTALGGSIGDTSVALSNDGTQFALVQNVPTAVAATGTATAGAAVPTSGATVTVGSVTYTWTSVASAANQMSTSGITSAYQIAQTFYAALTGSSANCPTSNSNCIGSGTTANPNVIATYAAPNSFVTVTASCGAGTCGNTVVWTDSGSGAQLTLSPTNGYLGGGAGTANVGGGTLVIVRIGSGGTLAAPTAPTPVFPTSYSSCSAPCMTSIQLSGTLVPGNSSNIGPTDSYSSPYYDYSTNTIWVGDDSGGLHQITNVFSNSSSPVTPTETTTGGWPVAVNLSASLGGPVFDSAAATPTIFVGDYALTGNSVCTPGTSTSIPCGYLYAVQQSSGTVTKSAELDYQLGIADAPLLDSTLGEVYAFAGADSSTACSSGPCAGVYQLPVGFSSGASGTEAQVGPGYEFLLSGAFDNAYFNSASGTGNLYVVGNTGPGNNTLYQIPISSGVMGTSTNTGPVVATNYSNGYYAAGQQVTEFYNTSSGNHDYIFLNVLAFGQDNANIACPSQSVTMGCVMGFDVTSGTVSSSTAATGVLAEEGGTSGIVIDNGVSGASNIYFSTLLNQNCTTSGGTGGCATQTTQSAP